jgi:hypothetical protein
MPIEELVIGEEVIIYDRRGSPGKWNYKKISQGKIVELNPSYILIERGYKERYEVIDFRTRRYRLFRTCGYEIKFPPLLDRAAVEKAIKEKVHQEYSEMKNASPKIVKALATRQNNKKRKEEDEMERKITREKLLELCKENGFGKENFKKIATILGCSWRSIEVSVSRYGIKKELDEATTGAGEGIPDYSGVTYESITKGEPGQKTDGKDQTEEKLADAEDREQLQADRKILHDAISIKKKTTLKPKILKSEETEKEYFFSDIGLEISEMEVDSGIHIKWDMLEIVIEELQNILDMRKEQMAG